MSTDPKSGEQKENKNGLKQDSDPNTNNIQSSPPSKEEDKGGQTSGEESVTCPKKISRWKKVPKLLLMITRPKVQITKRQPPSDIGCHSPATTAVTEVDKLIRLIDADLSHISEEDRKPKYNSNLNRDLETLKALYEEIKNLKGDERVQKLSDFRKYLTKFKLVVPSRYKVGAEKKGAQKNLEFTIEAEQSISRGMSEKMPQLHKSSVFLTSMELADFVARYNELEYHVKLCLLCFSIFPNDAIIKKRLMVQWWVVEGFASSEDEADAHFKKLMQKGFIEAVNDNRSLSVGSCRIHPFNRSALVALAERAKLFNFGGGGEPTQNFSGTFQACLMGEGLISYDDFEERNKSLLEKVGVHGTGGAVKGLIEELEKLHLVMNVDEHILEFKEEWFAKMRNLNILYLGRWKAEGIHHIEVEDVKFLKKLENMKHVKLLSLQGVSNVISLTESILQMTKLTVLDLRACYNLESIPKEIGSKLERLTHLDMSECYLLVHMPQSLSELTHLKVLKGFFVSDDDSDSKKMKTAGACTLGDLHKLEKLEKLCIYTKHKEFPLEGQVEDLGKLRGLSKLTITWGVSAEKKKEEAEAGTGEQTTKKQEASSGRLPGSLTKLDLKCFPMSKTPYWLELKNLQHTELKKLYIRGGKFSDLGQYQGIDDETRVEEKWKVEVLRLKYLAQIHMEWRRLQDLFPKLEYLEKVSCPNLTLFPCDANGLWIKPE